MSIMALCDRTLSFIGGKRLVLSDADAAKLDALDYQGLAAAKAPQEAVTCALHFGAVRDSLLEAYPWVFAAKFTALAELAAPIGGWAHSYALPADCLRVLEAFSGGWALPNYEITGGALSCGYSDVFARYTGKDVRVNLWPPCFRDAFCSRLASEIAGAVTGNFEIARGPRETSLAAVQEGYRLGMIDERPARPTELYNWDRYFNDYSEGREI